MMVLPGYCGLIVIRLSLLSFKLIVHLLVMDQKQDKLMPRIITEVEALKTGIWTQGELFVITIMRQDIQSDIGENYNRSRKIRNFTQPMLQPLIPSQVPLTVFVQSLRINMQNSFNIKRI